MIPKIVHVVWLGENINGKEKEFLEENKKIVNDYEYNLWTNDNISQFIDSDCSEFLNFAIRNKKYAFASDCLKLLALKKYGGWALDADVKIFKKFDDLNEYSWVSGFESWAYENHISINTLDLHPSLKNLSPITACWGSSINNDFTNLLLETYKKPELFSELISIPNTRWISHILYKLGIKLNNEHQRIEKYGNIDIFPDYYFCCPFHSEKTYTMHYFNGSWSK